MRIPLSQQQETYRDAKIRYEQLLREVDPALNALTDSFPELESEEYINAYAEAEAAIFEQHGVPAARQALQKAEENLLEWGMQELKRCPGYNQIFEDVAGSPILRFRNAAVDAIMKL